jgi:hypothetical protein
MGQLTTLKKMVQALEESGCPYCLVGGHAASIYRTQERLTRDIDFAVASKTPQAAKLAAEKALSRAGFKPAAGFIPLTDGEEGRRAVCLVTSIPKRNELHGEVDILLPELPWVKDAVERAQSNLIDLGFAKVPVITPEDLIVAKCYALRNNPDRFQDLDDIKGILLAEVKLDLNYLDAKLSEHTLSIPKQLRRYAPKV